MSAAAHCEQHSHIEMHAQEDVEPADRGGTLKHSAYFDHGGIGCHELMILPKFSPRPPVGELTRIAQCLVPVGENIKLIQHLVPAGDLIQASRAFGLFNICSRRMTMRRMKSQRRLEVSQEDKTDFCF